MLRLLFSNVKLIDDAMHQIIHAHLAIENQLQLLQTVPGIGEYSAIVLLAEMGDPAAFQKPKQLATYFGLDPPEWQSGKCRGTKNKISKRGSRYVRFHVNLHVVYDGAFQMLRAEKHKRLCRKPRGYCPSRRTVITLLSTPLYCFSSWPSAISFAFLDIAEVGGRHIQLDSKPTDGLAENLTSRLHVVAERHMFMGQNTTGHF